MIQPTFLSEPLLHRAARLGDITSLERLIALGVDINSRTNYGSGKGLLLCELTPLMVAAGSTDGATVETLKWLVAHGANLYARSAGGTTAVWYAAGNPWRWQNYQQAFCSLVDKLEYFLNAGLDPNECSFDGKSLLTEASLAGDPARVALLLRFGATVASSSELTQSLSFFQIPLFCAAHSGSAECVRLILEAGADPNTRDEVNHTALMYSASCSVARILIDAGIDIYAVDNYGVDALQSILEHRLTNIKDAELYEIARLLLSVGADIERRDEYAYTRLYSAAFYPEADAVEFLLNCGANPFALQSHLKTPLHAVCWGADSRDLKENYEPMERIINLLVKAGIDVNAVDEEGNTPLHEAANGDGGNVTAIRALIKHGAKADLAADDGITPLMLASSNGEVECVFLLLEAGASVKKKDLKGLDAIAHAQEYYENLLKNDKELTALNNSRDEFFALKLQQATECLKLLWAKI